VTGICGVFYLNGREAAPFDLQDWLTSFPAACPDQTWQQGACGLASSACPPYSDPESGLVVAAAGRLDNRAELCRELGLSSEEETTLCNAGLLLRAYQQWGENCPTHIYGDWVFALWDTRRKRLFLARDHHGCTALYYLQTRQFFAFACHPAPLLALGPEEAGELDEMYLAQLLVSWTARYGEGTIYRQIRRLPPAHALTTGGDGVAVHRYWRLEDVPELILRDRREYVEGFREAFDAAVQARLAPPMSCPAHGNAGPTAGRSGIAVSLSGGLDSSAVAATAAGLLGADNERLAAFTSIPRYETHEYTGRRFGDEWELADAVCRQAGNIDHHPVDGGANSPLQAICRALEIVGEPLHAVSNLYWLLDLQRSARAQGCGVLLTGQSGNASISWIGDPFSRSLAYQLRSMGTRRWVRERVKRHAPGLALVQRRRRFVAETWFRSSAIHPGFARRLSLADRWLEDPGQWPARSPREQRYRILMPGRDITGALQAQMGMAHNLEIRDATADARVLAFMFSVPDYIFIDPNAGLNRWLVRTAMEGRVPDEVRLNQRRGLQAADLAPRLRACAGEVERTLDEIAKGPAACFLDVPHMRQAWDQVKERNTPQALKQASSVLMRGMMAGLFINRRYQG
jgi:asparagine synthase (glutamine-hydrolysing)